MKLTPKKNTKNKDSRTVVEKVFFRNFLAVNESQRTRKVKLFLFNLTDFLHLVFIELS